MQFPIPRCDDEAEKMGNCEFAITADLDAGYWQVLMHKYARDKTGFFTPDGKKHFCDLPMGIKNAAPFFVCMMLELKAIWDHDFFKTPAGIALIGEIKRKYAVFSAKALTEDKLTASPEALLSRDPPDSSIIIDDLLLFAKQPVPLLAYSISVLQVFLHHRVSIKLRKTRFPPSSAEFVGQDLKAKGNAPAASKYTAIRALGRPLSFGDLHMLVGLFGFYSRWIPWFEDKIGSWQQILKLKPPVHTAVEEEVAKLKANWTPVAAQLLEEMKEAIVSGPVLKRPDWNRTFYVKTDWSSYAKVGALCQPECSPKAEEALRKDIEGTDAGFDRTISGLRLRPVQFISKKNLEAEQSQHSSVGELATGRWVFIKWHKYLWNQLFLWITDCNGITRFWMIDLLPTHQMQRWKLDMPRYDFHVIHRPEMMLCECNLLSRYNSYADKLRKDEKHEVCLQDECIEGKLAAGMSPNKGARALAAEDP
jgi:RNase H-like domain found in reverse transcriptase